MGGTKATDVESGTVREDGKPWSQVNEVRSDNSIWNVQGAEAKYHLAFLILVRAPKSEYLPERVVQQWINSGPRVKVTG